MRKIDLLAGAAALIVISVTVTVYIARNPLRRSRSEVIRVGVSEPLRTLSPEDILKKAPPPTGAAAGSEVSTSPATSVRLGPERVMIVHPDWQPGTTRVEGAYAVTKPGNFISPLWSPIGLDIAFTTTDFKGIYLAGVNTSEARLLADDPMTAADYEWNIDGMSLYAQEADDRPVELMITGEKYPLPERPRKVFERDGNIYCMADEGGLARISGSQDRFYGPGLSPDETKVLFLGRETGIYIALLDGSQTISVGRGENPAWLPDSSGIVFDIPVSDGQSVIDGDLWFASVDGRERTNLTNTPGIVETHPAVSPDGTRISFIGAGAVYVGKLSKPKQEP